MLPLKHEGPRFDPQNQYKTVQVVHARNPSTRETEKGESLGSVASQPHLLGTSRLGKAPLKDGHNNT